MEYRNILLAAVLWGGISCYFINKAYSAGYDRGFTAAALALEFIMQTTKEQNNNN